MVFVHLPAHLTDEEELLQRKFAKLRKRKKELHALRTAKPEAPQQNTQPAKRPLSDTTAEEATEQAKKLIKAGAIKLGLEKEKQAFKRSKHLEKKIKDHDQQKPAPVAATGFQSFAESHPDDDETKPRMKGLYDSFVRDAKEAARAEREERRERQPPKKGNTIYVHAHGITEDLIRRIFSNYGNIVKITMETNRNCGFITFDKMEASDQAIAALNGCMVEGLHSKWNVSIARRQPAVQNSHESSTSSWASIAASHFPKGSTHRDKRELVTYDADDMF